MSEKEKFYRALKWCIYLFMFLFIVLLVFGLLSSLSSL